MKNIFTDIPYADGHMGRRQMVDEKHLLVMQVALKPGQKVPQHDANSNVHLLVIEGRVVVTLSDKDIAAPAGALVPVAFQTPMSIRNDSDANASFLILKTPNPSDMVSQAPVIREDQTVAEFVIEHPELREKLEKMGIDYCCGGKRPMGDAVKAAGLEWAAFLDALKKTPAPKARDGAQADWSSASLSVLADYILEKHHTFMKEQLPRLDELLGKVQKAHKAQHGEMLAGLRRVFDSLREEIESHLIKEERILFPAIKGIDAFVGGTGGLPVIHCGSVANPIRQMELEHDSAGDALAEMHRITGNYTLPEDACQSFAALYEGLQAMEADLHEHIHLENNILFPKSIEREQTMNNKLR